MSRILNALAWFAPEAAVRRAHAFAALDATRGYDGAMQGRRGSSFKSVAGGQSANSALAMPLSRLRERSSDLVRNTWIGARVVDVLSSHTIGTGITVAWRDKRVQDLWDEWCLTADIENVLDLSGLQLVAFRSMIERGDSGMRMVPRKLNTGRRVPLALQVVEGDLIAHERDGVFDGRKSRLGVVLGEWNERVGYWLHREHPGEFTIQSPTLLPQFVDRADFCHLYRPLRAGQVRGVPTLSPVLLGARDYADTMDAMIVKLRMEACYGMIVNSADPVKNLADAQTRKEADRTIEKMSPGMIYRAKLGETVSAFSPSGSGQFEPVAMSALLGVASGGMITYDQLTGDLRQANYSSLRAGKIEFRRLIEQLQWQTVTPMLIHRIADRFIEVAVMAGLLRERKQPYAREYVMPAVEPIDPLKDLKADILAVRAGRVSPQQFIGAWGRDWRKVVAEVREFWKEADTDLGDGPLVLDIDPRRVNQSGGAQAANEASSDDDDDADQSKEGNE